jgi:hypoxanthine phosphoribosyltransferase
VSDKIAERVSRILFSAEEIRGRVHEIGQQISTDYLHQAAMDPHGRPPLLICVLHGALVFMADLVREIPIEVEYDFISVSSYGNGTSPGAVQLVRDLDRPIQNRDILIVEDIVDTGYTIDYLRRGFAARRPASIRTCSLIDKVARREADVKVEYVGFPLRENAFIVGYGMDYQELYRNLPFIGVLKPDYIT